MEIGQKLDIILIDDKFGATADVLLKEAYEIAEQEASKNHWTILSVQPVISDTEQKGEFIRYKFEIFGMENEQISVASNEEQVLSSNSKSTAAAKDAEI